MIHHDGRDYNVAKSAAAKVARDKMEKMIEEGRVHAQGVIEDVTNRVITDRVVRTKAIHVEPLDTGWNISAGDMGVRPLHNHAWGQVLADAEMDKRFVDRLEKQANGTEWGKDLIAHNLNTIFSHRSVQRNLVREEKGLVKGFLSDKFRRLDSRPLLEAFAAACMQNNLLPIEGYALETRVRVRAILPYVFEPIKDEPMVLGLTWGNSDYGNGGHIVDVFLNRMFCTNLATVESALRQIHLGTRLNDDITFSQETYRKDTEANISALGDVVNHVISPVKVHAMMDVVKSMAEQSVGKDVGALLSKHLDKGDVEKALAAYESHDVVNLPPGQNMWRLSNAISWIAQGKDVGADKKLELQDVAGKLLKHKEVMKSVAV